MRYAEAAQGHGEAEGGSEDPVEAVQARLGRASRSKTEEYLKKLAGKPVGQLRRRKRILRRIPARGPGRLKPGNQIALTHGATAKRLPELERLEKQGIRLRGIERELMRKRIVAGRALRLSRKARSVKEQVWLLEAAGEAVVRATKLARRMEGEDVRDDLGEEIGLLRVMMRRVLEAVEDCTDLQILRRVLEALGLGAYRVAALTRLQHKERKENFRKMLDEALDEALRKFWAEIEKDGG